MNPTLGVTRGNKWIVPLSISCCLLGFLATWAYRTDIANRETGGGRISPAFQAVAIEKKQADDQRSEIQSLRGKLAELEQASATRTKLTEVLTKEIEQIKTLAGLVDVEGPGITVLLRDAPHVPTGLPRQLQDRYLIHDQDLVRIVNELKAAGAEAVAVNGHRIVAQSFIRCAGPVVYVDGTRVGTPFRVEAIGDVEALRSAMDLAGGVLSEIRTLDPKMVEIVEEERLMIPSFAGSTQVKYIHPTEPSKQ